MEGIDRQRIDSIILRESGNSAYMVQQKKRDAKIGRAHVWTPVTDQSRMPSSAWKKKKNIDID